MAPAAGAGSLVALDLVAESDDLRANLDANTAHLRAGMTGAGFTILEGTHALVPVMFADEHEPAAMATTLLDPGIYVIAFSYPVVALGKARIRVQLSAAHDPADINRAIAAFTKARERVDRG